VLVARLGLQVEQQCVIADDGPGDRFALDRQREAARELDMLGLADSNTSGG